MNSSNNKPLSRRNWLGQVTTASLGAGLLGMSSGPFSPGQITVHSCSTNPSAGCAPECQ